jgi:hypothetical protein
MRIQFRFSLKTLLLLVAAAGVVCAFCAYHVNWIQKRHALLQKYAADKGVYYEHKHTFGWGAIFPRKSQKTWNLLWLFGEQSYDRIDVMIPSDHIPPNDNDHEVYSAKERQQAANLFPEADLDVHMYGLIPDEPHNP